MADIAKRLAFEDLSITLSNLVDGGAAADVKAQLTDLVRSYEQQKKQSEGRLSDARDQAVKLAQSLGGRQPPSKHQLRGLKSSLLNLTQKELFAKALLSCTDQLEFKLDAEECTAATLKSAVEDLKDLKKQNKQGEEHLQEAIQMIDQYQGQHQQLLARVALQLDMSAQKLSALEASRVPPASPLLGAAKEEDLETLIAQESQLAMALEANLVEAEASCRDLETDVQAQQSEVRHIEADIARLRGVKEDEARLAEQRHKESLAWCDSMVDIVALTTGVSLVSIGEDVVCVRIEQSLPEGQQANGKSALEHTLTAHLQPGTSLLERAVLEPATVEVAPLVEFAKETGGGLPLLLNMVRSLTYERWREQSRQ